MIRKMLRRADDFMLTAEELRLRRLKHRRIFLTVLVLLLALGTVFFAAHPIAGAIKGWQARRHAARVPVLLDEGEWNEAEKEAIAAYQLRPSEPEAVRAVARFLARARNPQALGFWKNLRNVSKLTREDLRDEATIALVAGETERAAAAIEQLLANGGKEASPHDWLLGAELALRNGAPDEVQAKLRKIFDTSAASDREQLQAAVLELRAANVNGGSIDQQRQADAWSRIIKLAHGKSDTALDALLLLAQRALSLTPSTINDQPSTLSSGLPPNELIAALENHPLAKVPHKLLALDLQMQADPAKKNALIDRAIQDWKDTDATSLTALAKWLNSKGEHQRELDTIPLDKALQNRELFLQHVDALGGLARWSEIKQLLEYERFPLDPVIQRMYLARCYVQLGEKTASENNWKRAVEVASSDVQKLVTLGDYAEKNGALDIAETAYNSAAAQMPKLRIAQEGRLRVAQAHLDTKKIHAVLAEMLNIWPNDTAIQNDEAYTRLLLLPNSTGGTSSVSSQKVRDATEGIPPTNASTSAELIAIEHLAEKLVQREPASLPHRTLLALARLRFGLPASALDAYGIDVPHKARTASAVAVRCAALMANGRIDEAKSLIAELQRDQLLPEERALIDSLL